MDAFDIGIVLTQIVIPITAGMGFIVYLLGTLLLQYWRMKSNSTSKPTKIFIVGFAFYIMAIGICLQIILYDLFPQCILAFIVLTGIVSWATWSMVEGSKKRYERIQSMREGLIKKKRQGRGS
jgi:hypothetical protein